jgi:hypothetical protein
VLPAAKTLVYDDSPFSVRHFLPHALIRKTRPEPGLESIRAIRL